jgi:DnaK suppressor protein
MEEAQARMDADLVITCLNASWKTVQEIQDAIDRVKTGEYGLCQACGDPITPKRLQAIPWARYCVPCQEEMEAFEAQGELYGKIA